MTNILDHPLIKDLEPQTEREGLLVLKFYITAIEATLLAVKEFGLEPAEKMQQEIMRKFAEKAGLIDGGER